MKIVLIPDVGKEKAFQKRNKKRRFVVIFAFLIVMLFSISAFAEDIYITVSDLEVKVIKTTDNYVYYAWKFKVQTSEGYYKNFVYTSDKYRYKTYYDINIYDNSNMIIDDSSGSFYLTKNDFKAILVKKNSVYGRYEKTVTGNSMVEKRLWRKKSSEEVIIGNIYLE